MLVEDTDVVAAVEEIGIDPLAAGFEELWPSTELRRQRPGPFRRRHERAQIIDAAQRVGAVELDVVGVVLNAIQDAAALRIPSAGNPGEVDARWMLGHRSRSQAVSPESRQSSVGLNDLAHLSVGGSVVGSAPCHREATDGSAMPPCSSWEKPKAALRRERARVGKRCCVAVS